MKLSHEQIISKANEWINKQDFEWTMCVREDTMEEHEHCYSFSWCIEKEKHLHRDQRNIFIGAGRLLISKDGNKVEFEGSAPGYDFLHDFELEVQGLEEYWFLEIPYRKEYINTLKTLLNCNTPELLKKVNSDSKIVFEKVRKRFGHPFDLDMLCKDLCNAGTCVENKKEKDRVTMHTVLQVERSFKRHYLIIC